MKFNFMKKCAAVLCSAAMLTSTIGYTAVNAGTLNLIDNSTFDSSTDGWGLYNRSGASASISAVDGKLALSVSALGTVNYAVQLSSNSITLNQGSYYRLSFDISSTAERYIDAIVQQDGGSYQAYAAQGLNLTSETQSISLVFAMEKDTAAAKLVFNCGNHSEVLPEHTIYIDNVILEEVDESQAETYDPYEPPVTINQLGYKTDASKIAVFRDITTETEFSVINAETEETVYTGSLYGERENTSAEEVNWYGDFSEVTEPGSYYITCGDLDASYTFEIADNVYDALLEDTVRMLYLQRCGCEVQDEVFSHSACHTSAAAVYGTDEQADVSGGWHDAGDYGRYVVPGAKAAADLLLAYDANPSIHSDSIGIPESGNGIPDILDEARYEIEWMLKMQAESGGVYHQVNSENNPGTIMPEKETAELFLAPVSTAATADFCAVMAMAYEYYYDIDAEFAETCFAAAENAWSFLMDNPEMIFEAPEDLANVGYSDSRDGDERYWAACQMYRATGDTAYLDAIDSITGTYYKDGLEWHMVGHYGNIALLTMEEIDTESDEYAEAKEMVFNWVNEYTKNISGTGYETAIASYTWGSNMTIANAGIVLALAYELTGDEAYMSAAGKQLHYLLGRNPNGMCYVTGYGTVSPQNPHHRPSLAKGQAMKGMLVGGVNSDLADPAAEKYLSDTPAAKCYIDDSGSYSTNEITIYWNSPLIYLLSMTEDEAAEAVKGDVNADGTFTIADVVMMQKWLLNSGSLTDWRAGDLYGDNVIDVFDLCFMRNLLLK
ncbi:MAG: glycoside hydrolase family 9 protein [Ruminococcus sp.]|nr:glycoside hydrolase family 9 protein [Ruminococcus sp.]